MPVPARLCVGPKTYWQAEFNADTIGLIVEDRPCVTLQLSTRSRGHLPLPMTAVSILQAVTRNLFATAGVQLPGNTTIQKGGYSMKMRLLSLVVGLATASPSLFAADDWLKVEGGDCTVWSDEPLQAGDNILF